MLDFLVDENTPRSAVAILREPGHRARHVEDVGLRGAPDKVIFARAQSEGWLVVTRDLGFGNLLDYPLGTHAGIVVLRGTLYLHCSADSGCAQQIHRQHRT